MDNPIFRINGTLEKRGNYDFLHQALLLILTQRSHDAEVWALPMGWSVSQDKGLVFYHGAPSRAVDDAPYYAFGLMPGDDEVKGLPVDSLVEVIRSWLKSPQADTITLDHHCGNASHDGDNEPGFLLYTEDWGNVGDSPYALFAVKPCYLWHGK